MLVGRLGEDWCVVETNLDQAPDDVKFVILVLYTSASSLEAWRLGGCG